MAQKPKRITIDHKGKRIKKPPALFTSRTKGNKSRNKGAILGGGLYIADYDPPKSSARKALRKSRLARAHEALLEGQIISPRLFRTLRRCGAASGTRQNPVV